MRKRRLWRAVPVLGVRCGDIVTGLRLVCSRESSAPVTRPAPNTHGKMCLLEPAGRERHQLRASPAASRMSMQRRRRRPVRSAIRRASGAIREGERRSDAPGGLPVNYSPIWRRLGAGVGRGRLCGRPRPVRRRPQPCDSSTTFARPPGTAATRAQCDRVWMPCRDKPALDASRVRVAEAMAIVSRLLGLCLTLPAIGRQLGDSEWLIEALMKINRPWTEGC